MTPQAMLQPMAALSKREAKTEYQRKYRARMSEAELEAHRNYMREWRAKNRQKSNEQARAYRARNPNQVRSSNLKKVYGITLERFNDIFASQGNRCAICRADSTPGKNWHVDHCHGTGKIRGILCHHCNLMIGNARDNVGTLLAAVDYLK